MNEYRVEEPSQAGARDWLGRRPARAGERRPARAILTLLVLIALAALLAWSLPRDAVARSLFQSPPTATSSLTPTRTATRPVATQTATATATSQPGQTPTATLTAGGTVTVTRTLTPTRLTPVGNSTITATLTGQATLTPKVTISAPLTPTVAARPVATLPLPASPTVSSFLPAPTLSAPGAIPGAGLVITGVQPALAAPATLPQAASTPTPGPSNTLSPEAQLIDKAVIALGYVWLCCGAAGLIAAAAVLVWLARRSARR